MNNVFDKQSTAVTLLIYGIRGSNPPRYAVYDCVDVAQARNRIEARHADYDFLGQEVMFGKEEAKSISAAFNKAMSIYPDLLKKYPLPGSLRAS